MELYKGTPRIKVDDCCKQFYDLNVFPETTEGPGEWTKFPGTVKKAVSELSLLFTTIESDLLSREMTALGLEIFSVAYARKVRVDVLSWRQSGLTRDYLNERNSSDIWDIMSEYNEVIAASVVDGQRSGKISKARDKMHREWALVTRKERELSKEEELLPEDYVIRAANLIGAEIKQADNIVVKRLALKLLERLGQVASFKEDTLHKVSIIVFEFHRGAELYLKYLSLHV